MKSLKFTNVLLFFVMLVATTVACKDEKKEKTEAEKRKSVEIYISDKTKNSAKLDTISYVMGMNIAQEMRMQMRNVEMNSDALADAIKAVLSGKESVSVGGTVISFENGDEIIGNFAREVGGLNVKVRGESDTVAVEENTKYITADEQRVISSAFGVMIGTNLQSFPFEISANNLDKGFKDFLAGKSYVSAEKGNEILNNYMRIELPKQFQSDSKEWLDKIAAIEGVEKKQIGNSNILHLVLRKGDANVTAKELSDTVKIHYRIISSSGKILESSRYSEMPKAMQVQVKRTNPEDYNKNNPIPVTLGAVSRSVGLKEAIGLVGKGGSVIVWVPSELSGNQPLRVEVELIDVLPDVSKSKEQKWLSDIAKQAGVKKTASGLLYKIENEGDVNVKAVSDADTVTVHYKGTTSTGKVFDASRFADMPEARQAMMKQYYPEDYNKDEPVSFPLNGVIKGWTEGMKLVGKGGKITLWIPSSLAYGERGTGRDIGPNEPLRFDVELLDVHRVK